MTVKVTVDKKEISVNENATVLEAARLAGSDIPTLCYLRGINEISACRICLVEVEGCDRLVPSCSQKVWDGMVVRTDTPRVIEARKTNLSLILSQHNADCPTCPRNKNCTLQTLAYKAGLIENPYKKDVREKAWDEKTPIIRDETKCVKCYRCVSVCEKVQTLGVWEVSGTGGRTTVGVRDGAEFSSAKCALCGQCVTHCPVGALTERDDTAKVYRALKNENITTVVQVAPAVRSAWAEQLGEKEDNATVGKMVASLRKIGFDFVFDTDFTADLTIMEEGNEFVKRFSEKEKYQWPMFTSCCPGWLRFLRSQYPEYTANLSTAKSPQQMFGAVAKSYFAAKRGIDPHNIFVVSVMPCTAKKSEAALPVHSDACGDRDVDAVITTREFAKMVRIAGINLSCLKESAFDSPLGEGTGAAVIFGTTGGVMDAALRSAYFIITGKNPAPDAFSVVRGKDGINEAEFEIKGAGTVKVAAVSGLGNARKLIEDIKNGKKEYDFVEVMACPGGCAGGGGQPIEDGAELAFARGEKLSLLDKESKVRFSHENSEVAALYRDYLGEPGSEKAHSLLHTDHSKGFSF